MRRRTFCNKQVTSWFKQTTWWQWIVLHPCCYIVVTKSSLHCCLVADTTCFLSSEIPINCFFTLEPQLFPCPRTPTLPSLSLPQWDRQNTPSSRMSVSPANALNSCFNQCLNFTLPHLDKVHDICPPLQWDDQEDGHPGQADVVKWDGAVKRICWACGASGVVLKWRIAYKFQDWLFSSDSELKKG